MYTVQCTHCSIYHSTKRDFIIEKQLLRWIMKYTKNLSYPLPFQAAHIIKPFLNSRISANHDKVKGHSFNGVIIRNQIEIIVKSPCHIKDWKQGLARQKRVSTGQFNWIVKVRGNAKKGLKPKYRRILLKGNEINLAVCLQYKSYIIAYNLNL